jgi:hypothetical protein
LDRTLLGHLGHGPCQVAELAAGVGARTAARVVKGHERQQVSASRSSGISAQRIDVRRMASAHSSRRTSASPLDAAYPSLKIRYIVARNRAEPVWQRGVARDGEGDAGVAQLARGAHHALLHRRLGGQEGAGDLRGTQAALEPQGQPYPRLEGERRVAAGKDQRQAVVGDGHGVVVLLAGHGPLELGGQYRRLVGEALGAPQAVDRHVARRSCDPGGRLFRHAVTRPALERDDERASWTASSARSTSRSRRVSTATARPAPSRNRRSTSSAALPFRRRPSPRRRCSR